VCFILCAAAKYSCNMMWILLLYQFVAWIWEIYCHFITQNTWKFEKIFGQFDEGQFYVATIFTNLEESVFSYCGQIKCAEANWDAALIYLFSQFVLLLFAHCWSITQGKKILVWQVKKGLFYKRV
jgi:hypothetical protein